MRKKVQEEEVKETSSLEEKVKIPKTPKNPKNMALPKGVKSPVDYTKLYMSNELEGDELYEAVPAFIKGALKLGAKKRMALFGGGLFGTVAGVRAIVKGVKSIKDNKK